jgi:hypothetical protein
MVPVSIPPDPDTRNFCLLATTNPWPYTHTLTYSLTLSLSLSLSRSRNAYPTYYFL